MTHLAKLCHLACEHLVPEQTKKHLKILNTFFLCFPCFPRREDQEAPSAACPMTSFIRSAPSAGQQQDEVVKWPSHVPLEPDASIGFG